MKFYIHDVCSIWFLNIRISTCLSWLIRNKSKDLFSLTVLEIWQLVNKGLLSLWASGVYTTLSIQVIKFTIKSLQSQKDSSKIVVTIAQ